MAYADLATIQDTDPGDILTAAWCDQVRDNGEFFIDPPACSVYNSTTQSISDSSWTILTCDSENYDNDSMHSTSSSTSRITIQTAGRYLMTARVNWGANATGSRALRYRLSGVAPSATAQQLVTVSAATAGVNTQVTATWTLTLAAAAYVEVEVWQNSTASRAITFEEFAATFQTR